MQNLLKVEVEGLSRLRVEDIYRISGLYPSLYFESDDDFNVKINQGIQKLWEIERFSNIQIYEIDNISSANKSKLLLFFVFSRCFIVFLRELICLSRETLGSSSFISAFNL